MCSHNMPLDVKQLSLESVIIYLILFVCVNVMSEVLCSFNMSAEHHLSWLGKTIKNEANGNEIYEISNLRVC